MYRDEPCGKKIKWGVAAIRTPLPRNVVNDVMGLCGRLIGVFGRKNYVLAKPSQRSIFWKGIAAQRIVRRE